MIFWTKTFVGLLRTESWFFASTLNPYLWTDTLCVISLKGHFTNGRQSTSFLKELIEENVRITLWKITCMRGYALIRPMFFFLSRYFLLALRQNQVHSKSYFESRLSLGLFRFSRSSSLTHKNAYAAFFTVFTVEPQGSSFTAFPRWVYN